MKKIASSLFNKNLFRAGLLLLFIVWSALQLQAQSKQTIYLENSETLSFDKQYMPDCQILRGNVIFKHDDAYLYCDSAYFYENRNSIDAFGHIVIEQGDSLTIYGDVLYYDGNTKLARLLGNVHMINKNTHLYTDSVNYDRANNVMYYYTGGRIEDKENKLTSVSGEYYPKTRTAVFSKNVQLVNPKFILVSDTLRYNSKTKVAFIVGPSTILYDEKTRIYSEFGWYNTSTEQSELLKNSYIWHNDGKELIGDTIYYDKKNGVGSAIKNVALTDTVQQVTILGHRGYFREADDYGMVTDSALLIDHSTRDTLYLHADTLVTIADSTYNIVRALHHVRFFREDMQGKCDSILYTSRDSLMQMFGLPVIWADSSQISGEHLSVQFANKQPQSFFVKGKAFAITLEDSISYNQLSGKTLKGILKNKKLSYVKAEGNGETIFIAEEDDGTRIGHNKAESSVLEFYFDKGRIQKVVMSPNSSGVLIPDEKVTTEDRYLDLFNWQENIKPKDKNDIYPTNVVSAK